MVNHRRATSEARASQGVARLEDIGAAFNITRERARQCLAQNGYTDRRPTDIDPIKVLSAARASHTTNLRTASRDLGISHESVRKVVNALGVGDALQRLYRWRRKSAARKSTIACLQEFAARHGRAPTTGEMGFVAGRKGLPELRPARSNFNRVFPSYRAMFAAAGIASRPKGSPGRVGLR